MKPKILISSERDDPCAKYTAAILAAGGLPTVAYCPQVSLDYDGLLLSGGGDIAPPPVRGGGSGFPGHRLRP